MFLNGLILAAQSINPEPVTTSNANDVTIGRSLANNVPFDGTIDDVAIWDENLTIAEVKGLFDVADDGNLNYDAGQFDLLKVLHDAGAGFVVIDDLTWTFASGLAGPNGLNGNTLILDQGNSPTAPDGTGVVASAQAFVS